MKVYIAIVLLAVLVRAHCKPMFLAEEQDLAKINGIKSAFFNFLNTAGCALQKIGGRVPSEDVDIEAFNLRRAIQGFVDCLPKPTQLPPITIPAMHGSQPRNGALLKEILQELEGRYAVEEEDGEEIANEQIFGTILSTLLSGALSKALG